MIGLARHSRLVRAGLWCWGWLALGGIGGALSGAEVELGLQPDLPTGQPAGTTIRWTASATPAGAYWYRFSVQPESGPRRMVREFHPGQAWEWTPYEEGEFIVSVAVTAAGGGDLLAEANVAFRVSSPLAGPGAAVSATAHPLVARYSVPPIPDGTVAWVQFRPAGSAERWQDTATRGGRGEYGLNFLVAGLRPATAYELRHVVAQGSRAWYGEPLAFQSGALPLALPETTVPEPADALTSALEGVLFQSVNRVAATGLPLSMATDLAGQTVWYASTLSDGGEMGEATRVLPGGTVLLLAGDGGVEGQRLLELDLAGHVIRETNVAYLNTLLAALGEDPIGALHHEATRFPDGRTLVLASVERLLSNVQGAHGPVDVVGNLILALDEDWQLVWAWNSFDFLDVNRAAVLDEKCLSQSPGCPVLLLANRGNDWIHGNAIAPTPDGQLLLSMRHQDWLIKIDYRSGAGTGAVLWRLGPQGDFTLVPNVAADWFTHQHHPAVLPNGNVILFDNGNTRCENSRAACHSRGQVLALDETRHQAALVLNASTGSYSSALGAAQRLQNGDYHFTSGSESHGQNGRSIELRPDGTPVYIQATDAPLYRSYRLSSLYAPLPGDLDADGWVTAGDLMLLVQFMAERVNWGEGAFRSRPEQADLNADGAVTAADLLLLRRTLVH